MSRAKKFKKLRDMLQDMEQKLAHAEKMSSINSSISMNIYDTDKNYSKNPDWLDAVHAESYWDEIAHNLEGRIDRCQIRMMKLAEVY